MTCPHKGYHSLDQTCPHFWANHNVLTMIGEVKNSPVETSSTAIKVTTRVFLIPLRFPSTTLAR